jgi:DNA-binding MarR family transcriptional regulator
MTWCKLEYALLVFVDDVPGISQQSLSEALGINRNNVILIADKLEARGLLPLPGIWKLV